MQYRYRAVDATGKRRRGRIEAADRGDALRKLHEEGLYPFDLSAAAGRVGRVRTAAGPASRAVEAPPRGVVLGIAERLGPRGPRKFEVETRGVAARPAETGQRIPARVFRPAVVSGRRATAKDIAVFTRQFAALVRSGVSVVTAVEVLATEAENRTLARALADAAAGLRGGQPLSAVLAAHPRVFPPLLVNLARAGEASGTLDEVMERAAVHFEKQYYTREKVKSALAYPVFVGVAAVLVTVVLLVKVIPTFAELFASYNAPLPWPTRLVLSLSGWLAHGSWALTLVVLTLWLTYRAALRTDRVRLVRDGLRLRVPVFGPLALRTALATALRTMATLFASGVPVLECMDLTAAALDNSAVAHALLRARQGVASGERMSDQLQREPVFPPLVTHMIRVGEETGSIDTMLAKAADFYEAEAESMADRLKSLLEPLLVLVLAVVVGIIVLSVIAPMFTLYQQMDTLS
ncbi:MAG: type II secretion system F family protein [Alicyclobacillus macrosporangiidus]|uniref:type II secretion system F family protein n=1 Tax=Alicyclobacillus macrosporangiidus TaxID=392015 RepID=UPI0026EDB47C|nr:type II secretion system F family protein [Alicyclobacillus macrosporangiidus]MCL6600093.1 type II secretion system F family protein [Alicyclobacillus macrosporangiidus]